jgi:DNA-binding CsgD family transcriptional regulator
MTVSTNLRDCDFEGYAPADLGRQSGSNPGSKELLAILSAAFAVDSEPRSATTHATNQTASPVCPKGNSNLMREYHLSPRRLEALRWLLLGDSEKQIALRMRVSRFTAHDHVRAIYRIVGVNSRSELMAVFLKAALDSHRMRGKSIIANAKRAAALARRKPSWAYS